MIVSQVKIAAGVVLTVAFLGGVDLHAQTTQQNQQPPGANGQARNDRTATDQLHEPLPEGAMSRLGARRFRHDGFSLSDRALAFTPDGIHLVGFTYSGVIIWDAGTGRERRRLTT